MILKGAQRAGARALADHLLNDRDNDHVQLAELRGFAADDLHGALREAQAVAKGTRCTQYLYSLSLNPPAQAVLSEAQFKEAADRAEAALGLNGQPRALVIHEKAGRRHAHVVWSRIDPEKVKAINLPHSKRKLNALARELFLENGWDLPKGLQSRGAGNPFNFTLAEWQQAGRLGIDPRELKQMLREAWTQSDGQAGFMRALESRGLFLAKGDRRGVVVLDLTGQVFSLSRFSGLKSAEIAARVMPDTLARVADVQSDVARRLSAQMRGFMGDVRARHTQTRAPLEAERLELVTRHRAERVRLDEGLAKREQAEIAARAARLRGGLRGALDWITGRKQRAERQNTAEALAALRRDQDARDALILDQMRERQGLQQRIEALVQRQATDRRVMIREIVGALRRPPQTAFQDVTRARGAEHTPARDRSKPITWPRDTDHPPNARGGGRNSALTHEH